MIFTAWGSLDLAFRAPIDWLAWLGFLRRGDLLLPRRLVSSGIWGDDVFWRCLAPRVCPDGGDLRFIPCSLCGLHGVAVARRR
jgi:hypothetical protein